MKAAIAKYLYWIEGYSIRQAAIISELSEDYVRKLVAGKRSQEIEPSWEGMTLGMARRKDVIDKVMNLRGCYLVEADQKFCYISLLAYMGFTVEELLILFNMDQSSFIRIAALRSGGAWQRFNSEVIGIPQEDYNYTFIEHESSFEPEVESAESDNDAYLQWKREERKKKKMGNRLQRGRG